MVKTILVLFAFVSSFAQAIETEGLSVILKNNINDIQGSWIITDNGKFYYNLNSQCYRSQLCKSGAFIDVSTIQLDQWWTNWDRFQFTADIISFDKLKNREIGSEVGKGTLECVVDYGEPSTLEAVANPNNIRIRIMFSDCVANISGHKVKILGLFSNTFGIFEPEMVSAKVMLTSEKEPQQEPTIVDQLLNRAP